MIIKRKLITPLASCYRVSVGILLFGLGASVAIYLMADDTPENPFAEYEQSKRFRYEVQRMGGKMALLANDAGTWFAGLWHGRQLAYTVACITLVVAMAYYVVASSIPPGETDAGPDDHRTE